MSLRNFCPGGRILLFNTSFGNLGTRAFILDHKKGVFKHFKGLKNADAATADLIRVVLAEILDFLSKEFDLAPIMRDSPSDVATRWGHSDGSGEIGFISSVSQPFCGDCVRARLSSNGNLFTCLFTSVGHDMSELIRGEEDVSKLTEAIKQVWTRRSDRYSEERSSSAYSLPRVEMSYIGG